MRVTSNKPEIIMRSKEIATIATIVIIALLLVLTPGCLDDGAVEVDTDTDGDGWSDEHEATAGTDPLKKDTDGDGYWDPLDENPLDQDIPESQTAPTPVATVAPTAEPTPIPTPEIKITYPTDEGAVARVITVKGDVSEPDASVRVHVYTEDKGWRFEGDVAYPDADGNWEVASVGLWPESGYSAGATAIIYAEMTISRPGVLCIYRTGNVTVRRA